MHNYEDPNSQSPKIRLYTLANDFLQTQIAINLHQLHVVKKMFIFEASEHV